MPDTLGSVTVPEITISATAFPLASDYGHGRAHAPQIATHRFGGANRKLEQRFYTGDGLTSFTVVKEDMTDAELTSLQNFWEACQGGYKHFIYHAPNDDNATSTDFTCRFAQDTLTFQRLAGMITSTGVTLVGVPTTSPTYSVSATETRFPSSGFESALLAQVQRMIPLVKIIPIDALYPGIYVSDRRCTVGGQLYQARLLEHEDLSQSIGNEADSANFIFGNADGVMAALAADTDLYRAELEFSLFHVGSGTKLDLWKGVVFDWDGEAEPEFKLACSDALFELTLPYPERSITRRCWKLHVSDACPNDTVGINSNVRCDKGWDTPAGCRFHEMDDYHGAFPPSSQQIIIKDNGTGFKGLARNLITSNSLVDDTVYGTPLPEVYTDIPMPVPAKLILGREESEFYTGLGVVSRGPIGAYGSGHTLDNQFHHGPGNLGLRESLGEDPNPDPFSLFSIAEGFGPERSAGTAFIEIRRADEEGRQLTRLSDHSMKAVVAAGLKGWSWSAPGSRAISSLVNPVWIVVNMHLRQRGVWFSSAAEQEKHFVVQAAIDAAIVCNTIVDKIIGSGTEPQFRFVGRVEQQKPLRDAITEVLMNCLGFFVNEFGKLKVGIRFNSSAVEAFTESNIILDSLRIGPIAPQYNQITTVISDQDQEWQAVPVELADDDHIRMVGAARQAQINLPGTTTKSQAARIITTMMREEMGGVTAIERKRARRGSFKTTVLALNTEVGQVDSLTHPKMPGGAGEFRIQRWTLHSDYSMTIEWRTTTDSMYDYVIGDKPVDVTPDPLTVEFFPSPEGFVWYPNAEFPAAADPMFGADEGTFRLAQEYETLRDGNKQATLTIEGETIVNSFVNGVAPGNVTFLSLETGGSLAAGDYYVAVCPKTADGTFAPPSNVLSLRIETGTTNAIKLNDIRWPSGATWGGYVLFAGMSSDKTLCAQVEFTGTLPDNITWTAAFKRSTWTMPNPNFVRLRAKGKRIWHDGVDGVEIAVVGPNTIIVQQLIGLGDNYSPISSTNFRVVSVIADRSDGSAALWNFKVTAYSHAIGTFSVTPDPEAAGVEAGDVLIIRAQGISAGPDWIEDPKWINGHYAGMTPDGEVGRLIRIVSGKGKGQVRHIASNTNVRIYVDIPWSDVPDFTSRFIVEADSWEYLSDGPAILANTQGLTKLRLPCDNMIDKAVNVCVVAVDRFGNESPEDYFSPFRPIWMYGEPPSIITITSDYTVQFADRTVLIDATANDIDVQLLPGKTREGRDLTLKRIDATGHNVVIHAASGETIDDSPTWLLATKNDSLYIVADPT